MIARIGTGSFSRVFQCLDLRLKTMVSVKVLRNDKDCLDAGLGEVKVLALLARHDPSARQPLVGLRDYFYYKEHHKSSHEAKNWQSWCVARPVPITDMHNVMNMPLPEKRKAKSNNGNFSPVLPSSAGSASAARVWLLPRSSPLRNPPPTKPSSEPPPP